MNFYEKILPQKFLSKLIRAVVEFDMIHDDDKILIGLSGGKDSLFLSLALANLKKILAKKFSLAALTINQNFSPEFEKNLPTLENFCKNLDIPFYSQNVDINNAIKNSKENPCYTCAFFRRGAINRFAKKISANKIAYAHHLDDAVETFFMNLLSSGQISTFSPKTFLSKTNLTVIRPLIYLREKEISNFISKNNIEVVKNFCEFDGKTNRQTIKNLIVELGKIYPDLFERLAAAMRKNSIGELWDAPKDKNSMREIYFSYVHRK